MDIAVWDLPYARLIERALRSSIGPTVSVQYLQEESCVSALISGSVDVALIPTVSALKNGDVFDVFPAFAVSSWGYPFVKILLPEGLERFGKTLHVPAANAQEAFVAAVVLQEHYGTRVATVLESGPIDAGFQQLSVGADALSIEGGLDVGQEWYELSNYPMVWGVFASLKGNATPPLIQGIADAAAIAERLRQENDVDVDPELDSFVTNELRFRFDDLATASITELTQYLYFYQGNDEIDELALVHLPAEDEDASDQPMV